MTVTTYFPALRVNDPDCKSYVRRTQIIGLIPMVFAVMLMFSVKSSPGPGLWMALGLATGMQMILWGAFSMHEAQERLSARGRRMVQRSDEWFPLFLFGIQQALLMLLLTMLWLSLCQVGYPRSPALHTVVTLLILIMPLNVWFHARALALRSPGSELVHSFFRHLNGILITLLIALTLSHLAHTEHEVFASDVPARLTLIWVPSTLIIITCIVSFAAHTRPFWKHGPEDTRPHY